MSDRNSTPTLPTVTPSGSPRQVGLANLGSGLVVLLLLVACGCQPVANPQARRGPFGGPGLFGNGLFAQNANSRTNPGPGFGGFANQGFSGNNVFGLGRNNGRPGSSFGFNSSSQGLASAAQDPYDAMTNEFDNLNQRLNQQITAYDTDNQLLNTDLAALKQKLARSDQYAQTLKQQLADTSARAQQITNEFQQANQQLANAKAQLATLQREAAGSGQLAGFQGNQAPTQFAAATLNANNSLAKRIGDIRIQGGLARMDGDVIRIEFPTDRFLVPGIPVQIQPAQLPTLQNIVTTIRQSFPRQIIGIEAHWDNTPLNPATLTHHQFTSAQALAVLERLVAMGVPKQQLFAMAMGSNRPRHAMQVANGIRPNRRIELVIYPETYDGTSPR